jgi:hypothetical protein
VSAATILRRALSAGVTITVDGGDLVIRAQARPPADVLNALSANKSELIALLTGQEADWDAEDYRAYFEERAAVYEIDGGLLQYEAERLAFRDTVQQWLALHPAPAREASRGCAHCREDEQPRNPLLPILARNGGVWVHDGCCEKWRAARRLQARQALIALGLQVPSNSSPYDDQRRRS